MYLLAFCCDHLYSHVTIPLIEYPPEFEQRLIVAPVEKNGAHIRKPWCEGRDFLRYKSLQPKAKALKA